jgi:hypothetical protein
VLLYVKWWLKKRESARLAANAVKLTTAPSLLADLGPLSVVPAAGLGWFAER